MFLLESVTFYLKTPLIEGRQLWNFLAFYAKSNNFLHPYEHTETIFLKSCRNYVNSGEKILERWPFFTLKWKKIKVLSHS